MCTRLIAACKDAITKMENGAHFDWSVRDALIAELKAAVSEAESAGPPARDLDLPANDGT